MIQFVIPGILIGIFYRRFILIYIFGKSFIIYLSRVMRAIPVLPRNSLSEEAAKRKLLQKKRTNRMLIVITVAFFVAWAPINIFCITKHLLTVRSVSLLDHF